MRKINEVGEGLLLLLSSYMKVNLMAKVASDYLHAQVMNF